MKRLVLLGGGHAHVKVLSDLAKQPLEGWHVRLVSPFPRQIYSGMLPGWIAGHYPIEACAIALDRLAARGAVTFHTTSCTGLNFPDQAVRCANGAELMFDVLSIDTGPIPALTALPGAIEHALPVRPIERFIAVWSSMVDRILGQHRRFDLVILGAGAAGIELALAIRQQINTRGNSHLFLTVVGSGEWPLPDAPAAAQRRVLALLRERGIQWKGNCRATTLEPNRLHFETSSPLEFDACIVATGAAAPRWPAAAGLATDERGFIRVNHALQCLSHPNIFAAGDVAAYAEPRPKSGVYAVRAGPVLSQNLRAFCENRTPASWKPQSKALYLVSTGDSNALAIWGKWHWSGRWVWRWKDQIDRRFMRRISA